MDEDATGGLVERRLPALYTALDTHERAGATREAGQVRAEIAGLLADGVRSAYRAARACWAERRDREAFTHFDSALSLHWWNLLGDALPVSPASCYRGLAEMFAAWQQPVAVAAASALALHGSGFYRRPALCQIPLLEGLYERLFGRRADGWFVEVGAFDGETYGNTAQLADLGWRGLYVEPEPAAFERCRRRHAANPGVAVLNAAIGTEDGSATLWVAREFSSTVRAQIDHGVAKGWMSPGARAEITVPQLRLSTALAQAGIAPGFELLVVDVEGAEEAVFAGFDLAAWRPQVLIVELCDFDPTPGARIDLDEPAVASARRVRDAIAAAGYEVVYADFTNTVFRRVG
jgi:FkbM family methyltransferase